MVRMADSGDVETLTTLAAMLWEDDPLDGLVEEFSSGVASASVRFFLAYEDGAPVGFAQCQLRHDYVEGTSTSPVGYLEGIFVKEGYRRKGHARELLAACEVWAKERGCCEFASDCELDNADSFRFHAAMHFTEANRIICFTKTI